MAETREPCRITGFVGACILNDGRTVCFTLVDEEGAERELALDHGTLGQMCELFTAFSEAAKARREAAPAAAVPPPAPAGDGRAAPAPAPRRRRRRPRTATVPPEIPGAPVVNLSLGPPCDR